MAKVMAITSGTWIISTFVLTMYHSQIVLSISKFTVNDIHGFHTQNSSPYMITEAKHSNSFILTQKTEQCNS